MSLHAESQQVFILRTRSYMTKSKKKALTKENPQTLHPALYEIFLNLFFLFSKSCDSIMALVVRNTDFHEFERQAQTSLRIREV